MSVFELYCKVLFNTGVVMPMRIVALILLTFCSIGWNQAVGVSELVLESATTRNSIGEQPASHILISQASSCPQGQGRCGG